MQDKPTWQSSFLVIVVAFAIVYLAQAVLFPIMLAAILYFIFNPLVRWLSNKKVPRVLSAGIIVIGFFASLGFASSRLVEPATEWFKKAPVILGDLEEKISFIKEPVEKVSEATEKVEQIATGQSTNEKKIEVNVNSGSLGYQVFSITSSAFSSILTTALLMFFLLIYGENFVRRFGNLIGPKLDGDNDQLLKAIESGVSNYLTTFSCINVCLAAVVGLALWFANMPSAPLWGVMAGLLNFIPYIGPLIGVAIVFMVAVLSFDVTWQVILPPLLYFGINMIEGQFITPVLLGKSLNVSPLAVVLAMILWGWAWGIPGALLSIPLLTIFKIVCDNVPQLNDVGKLLEV